jgi:restriction endonuclease S subunit
MKVLKGKYNWFRDGDLRLDASFHLSEGRVTRKVLEMSPLGNNKLSDVSENIFYGGRSKRIYVDTEYFGIPFMSSSDMLKIDTSSYKFISKKLTKNLDSFLLKEGWTLISRSGTIGNTVYVNKDFENKAASEHIIRVIPNEKISSGYLYAFLTSRYGYALMTQGTFGAVIQHIEPDYLAQLPIPIISKTKEQEIHELIVKSSNWRVEANRLLRKADLLFSNAINIDKGLFERLTHPNESAIASSFKIKRSEITTLSLRSRTYSQRMKMIVDIFKNVKNDRLVDVLEFPPIKGGRYKRVEVSESSPNAVELLNQGDIHNFKPKGKTISKVHIDSIADQTARRNMIIVPAVGTLGENEIFGRPLFVYGYLEGKVLTEQLLRIVANPDKIAPGYLFIVLKSKLFFRIFRSLVFGTNLLYHIIPLLEAIPIPRLSIELEAEIDRKIKQAYEQLTLAINTEAEAISLIEKEIESWRK